MFVDIYHDFVCPWCRIGKKHLFDAIAQSPWRTTVDIRWRAFLLDNTIPAQGFNRDLIKLRKGIETEELNRLFNYTRHVGEVAGVNSDFDEIPVAANTTLAHRLVALTPEKRKSAVVDAVYKAYFEDGLDIGDINVLVCLGKAVGIDSTNLRNHLRGDAAIAQVIADATFARRIGITNVPFFIINNKVSVNGSQSVQVFLEALNNAALPET